MKSNSFEFDCLNCNQVMRIVFNVLINATWDLKEAIGEKLATQAKKFYGIGLVGKSPGGGWPHMTICCCERCRTKCLIYAGVEEIYNSMYQVTIQAVTELIESEEDSHNERVNNCE
ncbi:MAG: hypothetical protein H0W76_09275 [Pyrinomonadaceae bacterium]|nr:hypothetical protein [Pyrinomonadaceae bacterium]